MAVPDAPTDLSAEATNSTTSALVWSAPDNDGGNPITGYFIERNLNDVGFATLVADTGNTNTTYTDSTLASRDNAAYRVSAINVDGTGAASNEASMTTATSEAQILQQLLFNNWALTGELSKIIVGDMNETVKFFDRGQIPGNKVVKAVTVQKINQLGNENIIEHPKFFEQSDIFEVTCFLQVTDGAEDIFSVWIDLMQQMTGEVSRILKTVYSPSTNTGEFFSTNTGWTKDDTFFPDDPVLVRTLRFTLTRLVAAEDDVFLGYKGVLAFDALASSGDSLPSSNYIYTEVERVQVVQGWRNLPYITTDAITTTAIPIYYRGAFSGRFSCMMYLRKSDLTPTTLNSLTEIFLPQANGELGTAVFLYRTTNTESPTDTLTESIPVNVTNVEKVGETEQLIQFFLRGNLTGPTSSAFLGQMLYQNDDEMVYEDDTTNMRYG